MNNVIYYLMQKNNDINSSFSDCIYFGSKPQFISTIRGTSINNLEEQLLIGCDAITEEWIDENNNTHIIKKFCSDKKDSEYYILETIIYNPDEITVEYIIDNNILYIDNNLFMVEGNVLNINSDNSDIVVLQDDMLILNEKESISKIDILKFISKDKSEKVVIKKITTKEQKENKKIIKEHIVNYLI